jgi:hypothetical protein
MMLVQTGVFTVHHSCILKHWLHLYADYLKCTICEWIPIQCFNEFPYQIRCTGKNRDYFSIEEKALLHKSFFSCCRKARAGILENTWDIFISYRQAADMDLVDLLHSKLSGINVKIGGVERKLRVFWGIFSCISLFCCCVYIHRSLWLCRSILNTDYKCLQTGENWETGFLNAINSASVVVSIYSRNTFRSNTCRCGRRCRCSAYACVRCVTSVILNSLLFYFVNSGQHASA